MSCARPSRRGSRGVTPRLRAARARPAQQGTPLPLHCLDQIETVADLRQGSVFLVEVVLFENPVPADLAEFTLVAHLDFAKPL